MMARRGHDDNLRGLPRVLDALGTGLLLAGCGIGLAAIFGEAAAGGIWYGAVMTTVGLFTRAAAHAVAAHEIERRGVIVPGPRRAGDGRSPATEREAVAQFERDMAEEKTGFVAMLEEREQPQSGRGL